MRMYRLPVATLVCAATLVASPALAQDQAPSSPQADQSAVAAPQDQSGSAPPAQVVEYSDAYRLRAKIHKAASIATLPLFGAEALVGESLYNNPTDGKRNAHLAIATGMGALFGVNTVTGVWNLIESRHDPANRKIKVVHAILMLASDGGFLATAALGPGHERIRNGELFIPPNFDSNRSLHRTVAFASISTATAGYLLMLFGYH